jgi:hypothetical protein
LKQAKRCRTAAAGTTDERTRNTLLAMAREYEERAELVKQKPEAPPAKD